MPKSATRLVNQSSNGLTALSKPYCSSSSGVVPGTTTPDRRVLTVAVVNCQAEGVGGRTADVHVTKWIDMFLVEPSLSRTRTEASDVYGEIIGETELGGGGGNRGNTVRRDDTYLIERQRHADKTNPEAAQRSRSNGRNGANTSRKSAMSG